MLSGSTAFVAPVAPARPHHVVRAEKEGEAVAKSAKKAKGKDAAAADGPRAEAALNDAEPETTQQL